MDYTTTKLAQELVVSHASIVRKVKKYDAKYGLQTLKLGTTMMDGTSQTVYQFSKAVYDESLLKESGAVADQRADSKKRGLEMAENPDSGLNRWRRFDQNASAKDRNAYKAMPNKTLVEKTARTKFLDDWFRKNKK